MTWLFELADPFRPAVSDAARWISWTLLVSLAAAWAGACALAFRARWLGVVAAGVLWGALGCAAAALVARAKLVGHFPAQTRHETFLLLGASVLACGAVGALLSRRSRAVVVVSSSLAAIASLLAAAGFDSSPGTLPPTLQSAWFPWHASAALVGSAAIALASVGSLAGARKLAEVAFAVGALAFLFGLASGVTWAFQAWSPTAWSWTARECLYVAVAILLVARALLPDDRERARVVLLHASTAAIVVLLSLLHVLPGSQQDVHRFF